LAFADISIGDNLYTSGTLQLEALLDFLSHLRHNTSGDFHHRNILAPNILAIKEAGKKMDGASVLQTSSG
jgi:hypothetical protein